jgi:hypothetical protein
VMKIATIVRAAAEIATALNGDVRPENGIAVARRFADWYGLMNRQVGHARQILNALLMGRLVFTPHHDGGARYYDVAGRWSIGRALTTIIEAEGMVTPAGFEPAISTLKGSRPGPG